MPDHTLALEFSFRQPINSRTATCGTSIDGAAIEFDIAARGEVIESVDRVNVRWIASDDDRGTCSHIGAWKLRRSDA